MSENKTAKSREALPLEQILLKIDEAIDNGSAVPFSNKKMVDADQMHEFVDEIRINIPTEIKRAKDMESQKKTILENAQKEADDIVAKAKQQADSIVAEAQAEADRLVSQQEIIGRANEYAQAQAERANQEAADIVNQAREKELAIREAMVSNINSSLTEAAAILAKNLEAVNNTRDAISRISE